MAKRLTWLTFILAIFGLVMISSAGIAESQRLFGSSYYYLTHQFLYGFIPGTAAFFLLTRISLRRLKKLSLPLLLGSVALLVAVFIPGIGLSLRGSSRWIDLHYFSIQPSEFVKVTVILYLSAWLSSVTKVKEKRSIVPFAVLLLFIGVLIALQPDLGTLAVISTVAMIMYFISGVRFTSIAKLAAMSVVAIAALSFALPEKFERIRAFINPDADPSGIGYHIKQSLIAIGSGGWFGAGFGKGIQKTGFLPEPVSDSIFSVIVEELGFAGAAGVLGVFIFLLSQLLLLTRRAEKPFNQFIAFGTVSLITVQALINIGAVVGSIPFTGITLPFISYGGSSLVVFMSLMGMNVRAAKEEKL